ncbi:MULTISPECIES: NAD(+)--rifampin ADP-ribosyltransferase [unclassified Phenylobacterium]|uniref:NAD(+)--rifampin ADP-ribosyltransferase n=1 Tax=unclassified Phenylobacterium TaxID=2640670 RepID=UPI003F5029E6
MSTNATPLAQAFFHGTKADLAVGQTLEPGYRSNFDGQLSTHVYMTATLDAAVWGAELAAGDGPGRIYVVEPTGPVEDDPDLTNQRFAGNPSMSFRSRSPLRIILAEVVGWTGHSPDQLASMKRRVEVVVAANGERP